MKSKLMECPACGREIARSATTCPHCGRHRTSAGRIGLLFLITLLLMVMFFIPAGFWPAIWDALTH